MLSSASGCVPVGSLASACAFGGCMKPCRNLSWLMKIAGDISYAQHKATLSSHPMSARAVRSGPRSQPGSGERRPLLQSPVMLQPMLSDLSGHGLTCIIASLMPRRERTLSTLPPGKLFAPQTRRTDGMRCRVSLCDAPDFSGVCSQLPSHLEQYSGLPVHVAEGHQDRGVCLRGVMGVLRLVARGPECVPDDVAGPPRERVGERDERSGGCGGEPSSSGHGSAEHESGRARSPHEHRR